MPWTERQHAILREMGLRLWSAPADLGLLAGEVEEGGVASFAAAAPEAEVCAAPMPPARAAEAVPSGAPVPVPAVAARTPPPPARRPAAAASSSPGDARRSAELAAMDWPALRAAVADCQACGLCQGRTQTVFGAGHAQAHWMIVGEAPGEQEDLAGEPFVGKAGQLLDRMLASIGLNRAVPEGVALDPARQVFIANVLKCRPPGNRNPDPQEVLRCEPFLQRQVALVRPRIILAMGRFAVQSLLRTQDPIGRLRGKVHHYEGVPVVVTYHPAYLLRNPLDKARSWEDLCLAASVMDAGQDVPT
jgi:uracil-DNA glycosylase